MNSKITGREPALGQARNRRRIGLKQLGPMLRLLPPNSIGYPTLLAAIQGNEPYARFEAALKLVAKQDQGSREVIAGLLQDPSPIVKASIARHLDQMTWFSARKFVLTPLTDPDPRVREAVIYALCRFGEREAFSLLAEHLQDEVDEVLAAAAHALRNTSHPEAIPVLESALGAADPEVRIKALEALSATGSLLALPVVRSALSDTDTDVRYAAVLTLLELNGEVAADEVITNLEQSDMVPNAELRAMFHAANYLKIDMVTGKRGERWLALLAKAVTVEDEATRLSAIHAMAWNRRDEAADALMCAYEVEANPVMQATILHITVSLMSPIADDMLAAAHQSPYTHVREAAAYEANVRESYGRRDFDALDAGGTGMARPLKGF